MPAPEWLYRLRPDRLATRLLLALLVVLAVMSPTETLNAQVPAFSVSSGENGEQVWSFNVQVLALMTVLTLLPAFVLLMTSFARIAIVLAILRTALGTQQTPSNQILIGLALFLTLFIMHPVLATVYESAILPWINEEIEMATAAQAASQPLSRFMLDQTRATDLELFVSISGLEQVESAESVPFHVLVPAFITSELKTAFQIGFLLFIPFLIIDLVVASVLMSMGMMMLSPLIISLPFKLMLFVMVDGWSLVLGTLAGSFYTG